MKTLEDWLAEYDELSKTIRAAEEAKKAAKEAILSKMRESGGNIQSIEAGGYRASISYREYIGFNPFSADGSALSHEDHAARLKNLHAFMGQHAPALDIPASENLGKAYEAYSAQFGGDEPPPLPEYLKKSTTPILRVSGGAANK